MAEYQPKGYTLNEFSLLVSDEVVPTEDLSSLSFTGENAIDLRGICSAWNYYESLTSPSVRMEFVFYDTVDLAAKLNGNEYIKLRITTDSSPDEELEIIQKTFKIGEVTKSERAQTYIVYSASPEVTSNEVNRVFKTFKDQPGTDSIQTILTDNLKFDGKKDRWEPSRGNFNFLSPNWRPYDAIEYITDKITGSVSGKSGYIFWETYKGKNLCTIDFLCSASNQTFSAPEIYTYSQANVGNDDVNAFKIETINYPDRANHLEKLRTGMYSTSTIGIVAPALTSGHLPSSGATTEEGSTGSDDDTPSGSIQEPINFTAQSVFGESNNLNPDFPFPKVNNEYFSEERPSRIKIRALPSMLYSESTANPEGNAPNMKTDSVLASAYAASRWQLMNAFNLDITVPGNVALTAGDIVEVRIPESTTTEEQSDRIELDKTYSGKYLIVGVMHEYTVEGVTTILQLAKDSISNL